MIRSAVFYCNKYLSAFETSTKPLYIYESLLSIVLAFPTSPYLTVVSLPQFYDVYILFCVFRMKASATHVFSCGRANIPPTFVQTVFLIRNYNRRTLATRYNAITRKIFSILNLFELLFEVRMHAMTLTPIWWLILPNHHRRSRGKFNLF